MRKRTAKKSAARRTTAKRTTARSSTVVKLRPVKKVNEKLTKSQLLTSLSEQTGVSKKDITHVLAALEQTIDASIKKGSLGQFTLPGLVKIVTVRKPATKARTGINPFTGLETLFKARPARTVVKVRALKKLKDMAA